MTVMDYISGACVGGQISSLSAHENAEQAMEDFCMKVLGRGGMEVRSRFVTRGGGFNLPGAFYTFTCGPEDEESLSTKWPAYATEFAKFIVKNKLGRVVTPGPRENRVNHPGKQCQAFIWAPDPDTLREWWKIQTETRAEREKKEAERCAAERQAILDKYSAANMGFVTHCGAMVQDNPHRYRKAIGGSFTVKSISHGEAYFTNFNGNQQYVHLPPKGATNYIELLVGAKYVIVDGDDYKWTVVEVIPEGYEVKEIETVTMGPSKCIKNREHCFCSGKAHGCCYCRVSQKDATGAVEVRSIARMVVKKAVAVEAPILEEVVTEPVVEPVAEELSF